MFHDVVPGMPPAGGGPERFSLPLESFERMLDAITGSGRVGCSVQEALEPSGGPRVAISFDDGTIGQFDHAVPALRRRGMTATFFVTIDWVGRSGFMSWDQLRQLREWGMSVQSHTKSHPHLSTLGEDRLREELAVSRSTLDRELAQSTTQLALPAEDAPRRALRGIIAEAGYVVVATSRWGVNPERPRPNAAGAIWVKRCTAPRAPTPQLAQRIVSGDPRLELTRLPRETVLNRVRAMMGADRYQRWRRRVLDALAR